MGHFSSRKQKLPGIGKQKFGCGTQKTLPPKSFFIYSICDLKNRTDFLYVWTETTATEHQHHSLNHNIQNLFAKINVGVVAVFSVKL